MSEVPIRAGLKEQAEERDRVQGYLARKKTLLK